MKSSHPLWLRLEGDVLRLYAVTNIYKIPAICVAAVMGSIEIWEIEAHKLVCRCAALWML